jgi:hypothetical protein
VLPEGDEEDEENQYQLKAGVSDRTTFPATGMSVYQPTVPTFVVVGGRKMLKQQDRVTIMDTFFFITYH